jgi:hypothetical protein
MTHVYTYSIADYNVKSSKRFDCLMNAILAVSENTAILKRRFHYQIPPLSLLLKLPTP